MLGATEPGQQPESAEKAQGDGRRLGNHINLHQAKGIERFLAVLEAQIVNLQVRMIAGAASNPNTIPIVQVRVRLRAGSKL